MAGKLTIIGMGPGSYEYLTIAALDALQSNRRVILRTAVHPTVEYFIKKNISYESCDYLYEQGLCFEDVYNSIAGKIRESILQGEDIVYVVPGSPMVAEKTVEILLALGRDLSFEVEIQPAISFFELMCNRLQLDPAQSPVLLTDALQFQKASDLPVDTDIIFMQVYNKFVASELKLLLLEHFEPESEVVIAHRAGIKDEECFHKTVLCELDRNFEYDYLTSVYFRTDAALVLPESRERTFQPIVDIMAVLRGEKGCVWDKEQDHNSLKRYLVEETYEVLEAIEQEDAEKLCDELGDVLLQVVFHAQIAAEKGEFTIDDVVAAIVNKMVRRHPHVFADEDVQGSSQKVLLNWEKIKAQERENDGEKAILDSIPRGLPALMRALKIQEKVAKYGFDWGQIEPVWDKVYEELKEFKEILAQRGEVSYNICEKEVGDILFSVVNLARFTGFDPETALTHSSNVFADRFGYIEKSVKASGKDWEEYDLESLDILWSKAKALNL